MKVLMTPFVDNPYQHILKDKLEERGIEVIEEEFVPPYLILLKVLRDSPDVLHLNWVDRFYLTQDDVLWKNIAAAFIFGLEIFIASLFTRIVWTVHNKHNHENKSPRLDRIMRKYTFWISDSVQVWDENTEEELKSYLNVTSGKITQIPHGNYLPVHGEDTLPSKSESRNSMDIDDSLKLILFFGNIRPYKQVPKLIEKFKEYSDEESILLIAGRAREENLERQIMQKAENSSNILFKEGFIAEDNVPMYFRAADIVALPFDQIFNSGSVLMALSMGRMVMVPNKGVMKSTVPENNIVYEEIDEGVREIFSTTKSTMEDIGESNLNHVKKNNNWDDITAKTIEMYEKSA